LIILNSLLAKNCDSVPYGTTSNVDSIQPHDMVTDRLTLYGNHG